MARRKSSRHTYFSGRTSAKTSALRGRPKRYRSTLHLEHLEDRRVLAPVLVGINANDGTLLQNGDVRNEAPQSLTLKFNPGEVIGVDVLDGISITRSGFDGNLDDGSNVAITPGYIGIGDNPNEVIVRFAESLPDDLYRINVSGIGSPATVNFELDLGAQVLAVVPQPVTRSGSVLTQRRDQIVVYFNDDDLQLASATNPAFYQLVFTGHGNEFDGSVDTANNLDDVVILPQSVAYDSNADTATLTFSSNIENLSTGPGTYRLQIGINEGLETAPAVVTSPTTPGNTVDTSIDLGVLDGTISFSEFIGGRSLPAVLELAFPGSNTEPGHVEGERGEHVLGSADLVEGVPTIEYDFQDVYGRFNGNDLHNRITATQKDRAREIFDLFGYYLGVQFVETVESVDGITVATGDVRAIAPFSPTDPVTVPGLAGITDTGATAIVNSAGQLTETFGANWFQIAMRQIGTLLGLGRNARSSRRNDHGFRSVVDVRAGRGTCLPRRSRYCSRSVPFPSGCERH